LGEPASVPVAGGDVDEVVDGAVDGLGVVSVALFIWPSTSPGLSLALSGTDAAVVRVESAIDPTSSGKLVVVPVVPYSFQLFWRRRDSSAPAAPAAAPAIIRAPTTIGHRLAILVSFFFLVARRAIRFARRALARALSFDFSNDFSNVGSSRSRIESSLGAISPTAVPAAWAAARRR
jgi:hypothetical protein